MLRTAAAVAVLSVVSGRRLAPQGFGQGDVLQAGADPVDTSFLEVSQEHVQRLCDGRVVSGAVELLGEKPAEGLTTVLAMKPKQAAKFLKALGLDKDCTCQELCEAAVAAIPQHLREALPQNADEGCLSTDCKKTVDVSPARLRKLGFKSPHERGQPDDIRVRANGTATQHRPKTRHFLRRLLAVAFRMFPGLQEATDAEAEKPSGLLEEEGDPAFGALIREDRKGLYTEYNALAFSWVSEAIRKIGNGRNYVKKWFNLQDSQVEDQLVEARMHLTMMLDLFGEVLIKKGKPSEEGGPCSFSSGGGTLAYVSSYVGCGVQDYRDCGVKVDDRYEVNICEFYWRDFFDAAERVGTMVHEASHHFGTNDNGYCGMVDCLTIGSDKARNNADSYTQLVKELVDDDTLAEDGQPQRPPCKDADSTGYMSSGVTIRCTDKLDRYGLGCNGAYAKHIQEQCPVTCNTCDEGTVPELAPAPAAGPSPTPAPTTATTTSTTTTTTSTTTTPTTTSPVTGGDGAGSLTCLKEVKSTKYTCVVSNGCSDDIMATCGGSQVTQIKAQPGNWIMNDARICQPGACSFKEAKATTTRPTCLKDLTARFDNRYTCVLENTCAGTVRVQCPSQPNSYFDAEVGGPYLPAWGGTICQQQCTFIQL